MVEACPSQPAWHLRGRPFQGPPHLESGASAVLVCGIRGRCARSPGFPHGMIRPRRSGSLPNEPLGLPRRWTSNQNPIVERVQNQRHGSADLRVRPLRAHPRTTVRRGRARHPPARFLSGNLHPARRGCAAATLGYGSPHQIDAAGRRDQRADFQAPLTGRFWLPADNSVSWLIEASTPPTTFPCAHIVHRAQSLKGILIITWGC